MEHWIEPQVLGEYQRTGYNTPLFPGSAPPGVQHYKNRPGQLAGMGGEGDEFPLPNLAPPGVQHYRNRPGQLGSLQAIKGSLPTLLIGAVIGVVAWPWLKKKIG